MGKASGRRVEIGAWRERAAEQKVYQAAVRAPIAATG